MLPLAICLVISYLLPTISAKNPHCCLPCPNNSLNGWAQLNSSYDDVLCHDGYVNTATIGSECPIMWDDVLPTAFCSATAQISAPSYLLPIMRVEDGLCPYVAPLHSNNAAPLKQCVAMILPDPEFPINCDPGYAGVCMYQGVEVSDTIPQDTGIDHFYSYQSFNNYSRTQAYPCSDTGCSITCAHVPGWTSEQVCVYGSVSFTAYDPYLELLSQFSGCAAASPDFPSAVAGFWNFVAGCYQFANGTNVVSGGCDFGTVQCLYSLIKEGF